MAARDLGRADIVGNLQDRPATANDGLLPIRLRVSTILLSLPQSLHMTSRNSMTTADFTALSTKCDEKFALGRVW